MKYRKLEKDEIACAVHEKWFLMHHKELRNAGWVPVPGQFTEEELQRGRLLEKEWGGRMRQPEAFALMVLKQRFRWIWDHFSTDFIEREILPEIRQIGWVVALETGFDDDRDAWNCAQREIYAYLTRRFDFRRGRNYRGFRQKCSGFSELEQEKLLYGGKHADM